MVSQRRSFVHKDILLAVFYFILLALAQICVYGELSDPWNKMKIDFRQRCVLSLTIYDRLDYDEMLRNEQNRLIDWGTNQSIAAVAVLYSIFLGTIQFDYV